MNKLANETSPYLQQHKDNPIAWHPWGAEAFGAARNLNRPIFLSIGYSTCYWCHVMEKDSFERQEVADILNKNFICIKVDREERPDVDAIYMDAVVAMTGQGGWPMSVFLTPDLKPFWGATFIPRDKFIQIASRIGEIWKDSASNITQDAEQIHQILQHKTLQTSEEFDPAEALKRGCESLIKSFDKNFGGFGPAPKFPPTQQILALLLADHFFKDERFSFAALSTLEAMGRSALHDHVEGGFHRYATDEKWEIPHFEKMLYDNALLTTAFLAGFDQCGHEAFLSIAQKTIDYLLHRLHKDNLFCAAEDAGEVGKEGEFYSWDYAEFDGLSSKSQSVLKENFSVSPEGNFEHKNTLVAHNSAIATSEQVVPVYQELKNLRDKRQRPHRDDKIITSWNGLALSAVSKLLQHQKQDTRLSAIAHQAAFALIRNQDSQRGTLLHLHTTSNKQIPAMLEDYAYVIEGLINLYQASFDEQFLHAAYRLMKEQIEHLWDTNNFLFRTSTAQELVTTKFDILDGALPSPNSVSYSNLQFLSVAFNDPSLYAIGADLYKALSAYAHRYPTGCLRFLRAIFEHQTQIVLLAPNESSMQSTLQDIQESTGISNSLFCVFPHIFGASSQLPIIADKQAGNTLGEDKTVFFLCEKGVCQSPTSDIGQLKSLLQRKV